MPPKLALKPFGRIGVCPACESDLALRDGLGVRFCEMACLRAIAGRARGQYLDVSTHSDGPIPHLHKVCQVCQFEWVEETAGRVW